MKLYKHMALFLAALLATVPVLGGCAPSVGGNDYAVSGAQGGYDVQYGTVQSVRMVKINNENDGKTAVGAVGGGVLEAILHLTGALEAPAERKAERPNGK